jgi:polyhydroxyalkanoate synthesis regulator phasin
LEEEMRAAGQPKTIRTARMFKHIISKLAYLSHNELLKLFADPLLAEVLIKGNPRELFENLNQKIEKEDKNMRESFGETLLKALKDLETFKSTTLDHKIHEISKMRKRIEELKARSAYSRAEYSEFWENTIRNYRGGIAALERGFASRIKLLRKYVDLLEDAKLKHTSTIEILEERIKQYETSLGDYSQVRSEVYEIYDRVKNIVINTINENPNLFSQEDVNKVHELITTKTMWEKINKNSILLLKESHPLPY